MQEQTLQEQLQILESQATAWRMLQSSEGWNLMQQVLETIKHNFSLTALEPASTMDLLVKNNNAAAQYKAFAFIASLPEVKIEGLTDEIKELQEQIALEHNNE